MAVTYPALTVVGGTTITATWGNTVRDGIYIPFTDSSDRDTYHTSPAEGMSAYLKDVNLRTWYDGSRWCAEPGQVLYRGNRTTSSNTTTTEIAVLRVTGMAVKTGQHYLLVTSPLHLQSSAVDDYPGARLRYTTDGSNPTVTSTLISACCGRTGYAQSIVPIIQPYRPASDHNLGVLLSAYRSAGTGNCSIITGASGMPEIDIMLIATGTSPSDTGVDLP